MALERLFPKSTTGSPRPSLAERLGQAVPLFSRNPVMDDAMRHAALEAVCPPIKTFTCGISPELIHAFRKPAADVHQDSPGGDSGQAALPAGSIPQKFFRLLRRDPQVHHQAISLWTGLSRSQVYKNFDPAKRPGHFKSSSVLRYYGR